MTEPPAGNGNRGRLLGSIRSAVIAGDYREFERIVKSAVSPECLVDEDGWTLMHQVAIAGDVEAGRLASALGYDWMLSGFDDTCRTPLIVAAGLGHSSFVEWVLGRGISPDQRCDERNDNTALIAAVQQGRQGVVRLLLLAGADPRLRCWMQLCAVDHAKDEVERLMQEAPRSADRENASTILTLLIGHDHGLLATGH